LFEVGFLKMDLCEFQGSQHKPRALFNIGNQLIIYL